MTQYPPNNMFARLIARLDKLPEGLRNWLVGMLFGQYTRYFRTNRIRIDTLTPLEVTLALGNHRKVRNHVDGIHAVAITLACEYASGLLVGQHVPEQAIVVVKTMHVDLHKPVKGGIRATARLTEAEVEQIRTAPKGALKVPVTVVDEKDVTPITGYMEMAWFPKKKSGSAVGGGEGASS